MPSHEEYVKFIAGQLSEAGGITYKKLFGEYGLWKDGVFFATVEDDQLYVKATPQGAELLGDPEPVAPHGGNPNMYAVEDVEDKAALARLAILTADALKAGSAKIKKSKPVKKTSKAASKLDYKKAYKELYLPKTAPSLIEVPKMTFIAASGKGAPGSEEYVRSIEILYGLSYAIKMSKLGGAAPDGYFEYVVPPLEGLWSVEGEDFDGRGIEDKSKLSWTSLIRQPEFVTQSVFDAAKETLSKKKPELDLSPAELITFEEGLCCQAMHIGSYDDEYKTIEKLERFIEQNGLALDINEERRHHEIYLSDPRRTAVDRLKTVIRHPVRKNS